MLKAIIIDSSAISRDLLNTILLGESYQVVGHSGTATQGLALAIKHKPQIICVDMQIVYDGSDFLAKLKASVPKALVFMMSNELKADILQDALARGVNGVIIKPFNASKVVSTIKNAVLAYIKRSQAQAQAQTQTQAPAASQAPVRET